MNMLKREDKRLKKCIIESTNFALFKATEKMSSLSSKPLKPPYHPRPLSALMQTSKYLLSPLTLISIAFPKAADSRGGHLQHLATPPW